jgi:predicted RNase H-like nuclease
VIAGVDGCKNGWIAVSEMNDGHIEVGQFNTIAEILRRNPDLMVIDIPIGLVDTGLRLADQQARSRLKSRGCCVFNAPLRGMLECADHMTASKLGRQIHRKGITVQTWAIIPKIKEVDREISPTLQTRIREGHPEVSFSVMNGGDPIPIKKVSTPGRKARLELLTAYFPEIRSNVQKYPKWREDVIDGYAMLWTARRIQQGLAIALPERPFKDSRGLSMQIWV